jgi:hypothetical protein
VYRNERDTFTNAALPISVWIEGVVWFYVLVYFMVAGLFAIRLFIAYGMIEQG